MASVRTLRGQRLVLHDVDWQTYSRLLRAFAERPAYRLTYDRGVLEIMSPLLGHDNSGWLLGRLVVALTEEFGLPVMGGGSTTFRRRKKRRGLEPDECFWIANEPKMRGKERINLKVDPPPDLAIEVDVTRSSLNRMGIYAALSVPEVWRWDGQALTFEILQPDGRYFPAAASLSFPTVAPADLIPFLALRSQTEENAIIRQFRDWIRQHKAAAPPPP